MQYKVAAIAFAVLVKANPVALPQGVTAAISPNAPAPSACGPAYLGSFAIAAQNLTSAAPVKRDLAGSTSCEPVTRTMAPVSQIIDGQVQGAMHTMTIVQICDGQIQQPVATEAPDNQPEVPTSPPTPAPAPETQTPVVAPTVTSKASELPTSPSKIISVTVETKPSEAPTRVPSNTPSPSTVKASSSSVPSVPLVASSSSSPSATFTGAGATVPTSGTTACGQPGAFALTLQDGTIKDQQGRTGYIASNYQFQFDAPPQSEAIYTSGFSICGNGSLALGGSNVFYQCLSGSFYNLYDRSWAAQCSPVTIEAIHLVPC